MKNFKITDKETNKEYWISRSIAVCALCYTHTSEGTKLVVERRGSGCPDNIGKLAFPCGYLDYDENLEEAVIRELYEETGMMVIKDQLKFTAIISDPKRDSRQNVSARFVVNILPDQLKDVDLDSESRGGEPNEVSEICLIGKDNLGKPEDWAFNHYEIACKLLNNQTNPLQRSY